MEPDELIHIIYGLYDQIEPIKNNIIKDYLRWFRKFVGIQINDWSWYKDSKFRPYSLGILEGLMIRQREDFNILVWEQEWF